MTAATKAREAASHFEAKKTGFGQAQDGWSLTLRIQDNDVPDGVAKAKKGTRYMVALVEIGDDEQPINRKEAMPVDGATNDTVATTPRPSVVPASAAGAETLYAHKLRKPWAETPYVTQVAIRCGEILFRVFLHEYCGVKAIAPGGPACSNEDAAAFVRKHCRVQSRKEILPGTEAETYWQQIEEWFAAWRARDRVA